MDKYFGTNKAARKDSGLPATSAVRLDGEHPFQPVHRGHWSKGPIGLGLLGFAVGHDALAVLAVWGEHTVESGEVQPSARNQGCQAGYEVQWIEDDLGGGVAKRLLELLDDPLPFVGGEARARPHHCTHTALFGRLRARWHESKQFAVTDSNNFDWKFHCCGLFQAPVHA